MVFKRRGDKREVVTRYDTIQGMNAGGEARALREMRQWSMERDGMEVEIALTQQRGTIWRFGRRVYRQFQCCVHHEPCYLTSESTCEPVSWSSFSTAGWEGGVWAGKPSVGEFFEDIRERDRRGTASVHQNRR